MVRWYCTQNVADRAEWLDANLPHVAYRIAGYYLDIAARAGKHGAGIGIMFESDDDEMLYVMRWEGVE